MGESFAWLSEISKYQIKKPFTLLTSKLTEKWWIWVDSDEIWIDIMSEGDTDWTNPGLIYRVKPCIVINFQRWYWPYIIASKLPLIMYSYTRSLSGPSEQHPTRRTRFLCWILVIILTSDRNSVSPCWDFSRANFFTAIILPSPNTPCHQIIPPNSEQKWKNH